MSIVRPGKHNPLHKEWRRIGRGRSERFIMEHRQAVLESLKGSTALRQVLIGAELYGEDPAYWDGQAKDSVPWFLLDDEDLDRVASVRGTNGLCGIYAPTQAERNQIATHRFVLVAWQVSDPGNLGTIIRSCAGLTGGAVILIGGCKPWSSKVARSSAGTLLKTPVRYEPSEAGGSVLDWLKGAGFELHAAVPRGGDAPSAIVWPERTALLVGNETHGVPDNLLSGCHGVTLPMKDSTESLNVSVAASILMHEWNEAK